MNAPHIPHLFWFENYLNNYFAYCCTSTLVANVRGPCIPGYLGLNTF